MMNFKIIIVVLIIFLTGIIEVFAQKMDVVLDSVSITSDRIQVPLSKESKSIRILSKKEIEKLPVNSVSELLQSFTSLDIKKRGLGDSQADVHFRGGTFEQTLILINGFNVNDPQTGHHNMNLTVSLDDIDRVEIVKGAASRIYGYNALNGVVNIITEPSNKNSFNANLSFGTFSTEKINFGVNLGSDKISQQLSYSKSKSKGYKFNTDFDNYNLTYKFKSNFSFGKINFIASTSERKFGANGFYASPKYVDQYEETETGLIGIKYTKVFNALALKVKGSIRRNIDDYFFLRHNPEYYHNHHESLKRNVEVHTKYTSSLGITGIGVQANNTVLESTNLGNWERNTISGFIEHRFSLAKFDVTAGVLFSHFSDLGHFIYPGVDIGYSLSDNIKIYSSLGKTTRPPSYTELYYNGPTTKGNPDLKPETAFNGELGMRFSKKKYSVKGSLYMIDSRNLIDYFKDDFDDLWQAKNQNHIVSKGMELEFDYKPGIKFLKYIRIGYNYNVNDVVDDYISKYNLNNLRHKFYGMSSFDIYSNLSGSVSFRYFDRVNYKQYNLVDLKLSYKFKSVDVYMNVNNIFDTKYHEANLVEMPGRYFELGVKI